MPIDPAKGQFCDCPPQAGPDDDSPGEGEQAVAEAERRGLPDGMRVEEWSWRAFREARREASTCRSLAETCATRAQQFIDTQLVAMRDDGEGGMVQADNEDQARRWLDLAAKFRQSVAKAIDTESKLLKLASGSVALRERRAAKERRDRLLRSLKGRN